MSTVLNVDDNPATRYARTRVLRHAGFNVVEAGTGEDALALAVSASPQIVLMDVRLPDMNGIEVCRHIKADPLTMSIPVIQISATFVTEQDKLSGLEGGAEVYLAEPVEPQELITAVRTLLRLRSVERHLSEAETRWRRLFGANIIGIFVADVTRIIEANDVFLRMIGISRPNFCAQRLDLEAITPAEFRAQDAAATQEIRSNGSCTTYEKEFLAADGTRVRVLVGGARLSDTSGQWIGFALDISDRRRVEAEREKLLAREQEARREAEHATQIRDEFLANLSHELRTPMSTITGWLHLLRGGRLGKEESTHAIEAIERATRAQNQLIEDLLDVSRIVAGKLHLDMERVELGKLIDLSVENVALSARTKGVALVHPSLPADIAVMGDRRRLQQVLWNLLVNAIKFTPSGGEITLTVDSDDERIRITVRDTGEGIAPDFLPHVFERFRQADGSSTRRHSGMGLGLAIVRHVVEMHGGAVVAHSEGPGKGAVFSFVLPRAPAAKDEAHRAPEPISAAAERPLQGMNILVLDDDADAREVIGAILEQSGARCRTAASAVEALDVLEHWDATVIISDIGMANIDGYGFMERLLQRERGSAVPAIALTAFAREEDRARALASGYQAHVAKPVDPRTLVDTLLQVARR